MPPTTCNPPAVLAGPGRGGGASLAFAYAALAARPLQSGRAEPGLRQASRVT